MSQEEVQDPGFQHAMFDTITGKIPAPKISTQAVTASHQLRTPRGSRTGISTDPTVRGSDLINMAVVDFNLARHVSDPKI